MGDEGPMDPHQLAAQARLFVASATGYEPDDPECHDVLQRALGLITIMAEALEQGGAIRVDPAV